MIGTLKLVISLRVFNYSNIAKFYEPLAEIFSLGRIRHSKQWQLMQLNSGQSILYVGSGRGEDAVMAAKSGLRVTCVDITHEMLEGVRQRFAAEGLSGTFNCCNVLDYQPAEKFDAIALNYFLNMFKRKEVCLLLLHCKQFLTAQGVMMLADFAVPPKGAFFLIQQLYWLYACLFFTLFRQSEFHIFYDYRSILADLGMHVTSDKYFPLFSFLPYPRYETIVAHPS